MATTSNQRRRAREKAARALGNPGAYASDGHTAFAVNMPKLPPRRARRPLSFWDQGAADAMTAPEQTS